MFLFDDLPSNLLTYSLKEEAAFVRLHALVRKGYRADLGGKDDTGLISLEHPSGASAGAPTLLLCFDGRIIARDNIRPLNSGNGTRIASIILMKLTDAFSKTFSATFLNRQCCRRLAA